MPSNSISITRPATLTTSAAEVESQMVQIVDGVKREISIPVAVKLSPLFTAFANFATQLDAAGVDALVLFTRFHKVDIDVVELEVCARWSFQLVRIWSCVCAEPRSLPDESRHPSPSPAACTLHSM